MTLFTRIFFFVTVFFVLGAPLTFAHTSTESGQVATAVAQVKYTGMLPDSPMYKLMILWDRIGLTFETNRVKKSEKYIAIATRELSAAEALLDNGNQETALHTAFRGEHYMTNLVDETKAIAYMGNELDRSILAKAHEAALVHQALLHRMIEKTSGETQSSLQVIHDFSVRNNEELTKLEQEINQPEPANYEPISP